MEVVKNLSEDQLDHLRAAFEAASDSSGGSGLDIDAFSSVLSNAAMDKGLSPTVAGNDESLRDLFHEIDYNGDTKVTWEEFTMFIIDNAVKGKYEADETIRKYVPTKASKVPVGESAGGGGFAVAAEVRKLLYFAEQDEIIKVSTFANQHKLKVISPQTLKGTRASPRLPHAVCSVDRIPDPDLLVASTAGMRVDFWDMSVPNVGLGDVATVCDYHESAKESLMTLKKSVAVPETQLVVRYCQRYNKLFSASRTGSLNYWSMERLDIAMTLPKVHDEAILDLLVVDQEAITASLDSSIKILNLERNVCTGKLKGHTQGVCALAFSKQHQFLISAGFEYDPLVWVLHIKDFRPWRLADKQQPHHGTILGLYTVPDTPQVITADSHGMVKVWDLRTFQAVQTIIPWQEANQAHARSNLFSAMTYVNSADSIVLSGPRSTFVYKYQQTSNYACADNTPVLTAMYSGITRTFLTVHKTSIKIWSEATGLIESVFDDVTPDEITAFCLCSRGRKFFAGTITGKVEGFVTSTGASVQSFDPHKNAVTHLLGGTGTRGYKFILSLAPGDARQAIVHADSSDASNVPATALNLALKGVAPTTACITEANALIAIGTTSGRVVCVDTNTFAVSHVIEPAAPSSPTQPLAPAQPDEQTTPASASAAGGAASYLHTSAVTPAAARRESSFLPRLHSIAGAVAGFTRRAAAARRQTVVQLPPPLRSAATPDGAPADGTRPSICATAQAAAAAAAAAAASSTAHAGCEAEVSAMCLLGTLPAVACGDSSGLMYAWCLRPYLYPMRLLCKWRPGPARDSSRHLGTRGADAQAAVRRSFAGDPFASTTMCFVQCQQSLYVGSDDGYVRVYLLRRPIEKAGLQPTKFPSSSFKAGAKQPKNYTTASHVPCTLAWKAHVDEVSTVEVVTDNNRITILTAGFDLKVLLWSTDGVLIGSLCQGRVRERMPHPKVIGASGGGASSTSGAGGGGGAVDGGGGGGEGGGDPRQPVCSPWLFKEAETCRVSDEAPRDDAGVGSAVKSVRSPVFVTQPRPTGGDGGSGSPEERSFLGRTSLLSGSVTGAVTLQIPSGEADGLPQQQDQSQQQQQQQQQSAAAEQQPQPAPLPSQPSHPRLFEETADFDDSSSGSEGSDPLQVSIFAQAGTTGGTANGVVSGRRDNKAIRRMKGLQRQMRRGHHVARKKGAAGRLDGGDAVGHGALPSIPRLRINVTCGGSANCGGGGGGGGGVGGVSAEQYLRKVPAMVPAPPPKRKDPLHRRLADIRAALRALPSSRIATRSVPAAAYHPASLNHPSQNPLASYPYHPPPHPRVLCTQAQAASPTQRILYWADYRCTGGGEMAAGGGGGGAGGSPDGSPTSRQKAGFLAVAPAST